MPAIAQLRLQIFQPGLVLLAFLLDLYQSFQLLLRWIELLEPLPDPLRLDELQKRLSSVWFEPPDLFILGLGILRGSLVALRSHWILVRVRRYLLAPRLLVIQRLRIVVLIGILAIRHYLLRNFVLATVGIIRQILQNRVALEVFCRVPRNPLLSFLKALQFVQYWHTSLCWLRWILQTVLQGLHKSD